MVQLKQFVKIKNVKNKYCAAYILLGHDVAFKMTGVFIRTAARQFIVAQ